MSGHRVSSRMPADRAARLLRAKEGELETMVLTEEDRATHLHSVDSTRPAVFTETEALRREVTQLRADLALVAGLLAQVYESMG